MTNSYEDLIRQIQYADRDERRQLLDQLVTQFAEAAHRWALIVLEDENVAHDAVQDAWLSAYLHLDQLRESAAFPAWFRQIVVASSHHAIRGEKPAMPLTDEISAFDEPAEEIEMKERQQHVREAVQSLPEHERIVTELFYFAEVSQQEIAETLDIPLTTVKKRLQYARQRLKSLIQPDIMAHLDGLSTTLDEDDDYAWYQPDLTWEVSAIQPFTSNWLSILSINEYQHPNSIVLWQPMKAR